MKRPFDLTVLTIAVVLAAGCTVGAVGGRSETNPVSPDALSATSAIPDLSTVTTSPGCTPPNLKVAEVDLNEPITRRGSPEFPPILAVGERLSSLADVVSKGLPAITPKEAPADLPLQAILFDAATPTDADVAAGHASSRFYYSREPIGSATTIVDLYRAGGVYLSASVTSGQDAKLVVETVGDAATVIKVGAYDAALVHSSPLEGGLRTWNLYWSDGKIDYAIIGNVSVQDLVGAAQSMFC
jgi:hypothetical protein